MRYLVHITHTTMGVRVEVPVRQVELAILDWATRNLHAPKMGKDHGRIVVENGDGYYVHIPSLRTFIFHKAYHDRIVSIINHVRVAFQLEIEIREHLAPHNEPYRCSFDNYGFDMVVTDPDSRFYYQNEVVETATAPGREQTIFEIQTGRGKCQRHGTKVRIPGGWTPVELLVPGNRVIGADGKPTTVTAVYPQGIVNLHRVTFWDGRFVDVCEEHLWSSFYVNTTENRRWGVRNTAELKRLIDMPNPRVYIPLPEPEETTEKEFPINPYLLGALLGNGCLRPHLSWATNDPDTLELVRKYLPAGYVINHSNRYSYSIHRKGNRDVVSLHLALHDFGLMNHVAHEKFIPDEYFEGSIEQRWELLRGLMDTDGTVNKDGGQPSYCTVSRDLAYGIQELVRSLGGIAKISTKRPYYTYKGERLEGQLAYIVFMRHPTPSKMFNLQRKKDLCKDNGQYTDILKLRVKSIEPVGRDYGTCITVDNADSLYVVKQWIVTHNTKTFQKVMVKKGVRTGLIHRPSYVAKWLYDCCEDPTGLREDRDAVHVCKGVESIYEAIEMGRSGELDRRGIKIVIFPTVSLFLFLKEYINTAHSNHVCLEDIFNDLGIGLVGSDEVHEHFYLVYIAGIMLNQPAAVEMSATLTPGASKAFLAERYLERLPKDARVTVPFIPVVDVRAIYYSIEDKKLARKINKTTPYNHKMVEGDLVKAGAHESFGDMCYDLMERTFLKAYEPGQKALFFFATVAMCEFFTKFLEYKLAGSAFQHLKVVKYNAGDSYDDFIAADIGVSTPGKAGTAIDIPGLVQVYVTIPIDDQQLNEQITGRPRAQTRWNLDPKVWFLHCGDVPKHGVYLTSRKRSLGDKVKSFQIAFSPYVIRSNNVNTPAASNASATVLRANLSKFPRKSVKSVSRRRRRR